MADTDAANEQEQGAAEEAQGYIPGREANNVVIEALHEEEEAYALEAETRRWVASMTYPFPPPQEADDDVPDDADAAADDEADAKADSGARKK